ncbi:hypothetical protein Bbelb_204450 [Branchiostoma belcheri]|nr:hypothetical protein Bbelb_204450 [Branchiostoma belcheri]
MAPCSRIYSEQTMSGAGKTSSGREKQKKAPKEFLGCRTPAELGAEDFLSEVLWKQDGWVLIKGVGGEELDNFERRHVFRMEGGARMLSLALLWKRPSNGSRGFQLGWEEDGGFSVRRFRSGSDQAHKHVVHHINQDDPTYRFSNKLSQTNKQTDRKSHGYNIAKKTSQHPKPLQLCLSAGNQLYNATSGHFLVAPTGHGHPSQQPLDGIRASDLDLAGVLFLVLTAKTTLISTHYRRQVPAD